MLYSLIKGNIQKYWCNLCKFYKLYNHCSIVSIWIYCMRLCCENCNTKKFLRHFTTVLKVVLPQISAFNVSEHFLFSLPLQTFSFSRPFLSFCQRSRTSWINFPRSKLPDGRWSLIAWWKSISVSGRKRLFKDVPIMTMYKY